MNSHPELPHRILLADDDAIFCAAATSSLAAGAFRVSVVNDGADAFEMLGMAKFELAIVDLAMPRIDGFRLIALIRSTPALAKLPIIVVTSSENLEDEVEAQRLGVDFFMHKPIDWRTFADAVGDVLAAAGRGQGNRCACQHPSHENQ